MDITETTQTFRNWLQWEQDNQPEILPVRTEQCLSFAEIDEISTEGIGILDADRHLHLKDCSWCNRAVRVAAPPVVRPRGLFDSIAINTSKQDQRVSLEPFSKDQNSK